MMGITSAAVVARPLERLLTHQVASAMIAGLVLATPLWPGLKQWAARMLETLPLAAGSFVRATGNFAYLLLAMALLIISAAWLAGETYNPFIYFRF